MNIKIGMRSIKTGLAVFICLAIYAYIPLSDPILAVLMAVAAIQNNIDDSVTFSKNRLMGTILGTLTGIVYNQIAGNSLIFIALGVIVLITLLNSLNQAESIRIAMAVFVSIISEVSVGNPILYGLNKFFNTLLGLVIGLLVNYFIRPPNQIEVIKLNAIQVLYEIESIVDKIIFTKDKISLRELKNNIEEIEANLSMYNLDKKYNVVKMDKIKYVENSINNYRKIYSKLYLIKDKRALLNEENIEKAKKLFYKQYIPLKPIKADAEYTIIYNYHMKNIMREIIKIKKDLDSVTKSKAIMYPVIKERNKLR